eukprot:TRINITY_DN1184_c0_g1_i4.p2 TRINITY_DN1184_c0_g1~~TRINITY_DN1184_c0_g1_i4.p2  ORF type:complete len:106 (-),score=22.19 TRINITY_DN1184_c0_g1_i4:35-352(-)
MALSYKAMAEYKEAKKALIRASKIKHTQAIKNEFNEVKELLKKQKEKERDTFQGVFKKIEETEHLYEDAQPEPKKMETCTICGEQVEPIQLARHMIKKHTDKPGV